MMTYGLFLLLALATALFAYRPLRQHILDTQALTDAGAKNRVLGYQTPDFESLAKNIFTEYNFTPYDIEKYRLTGSELPYLSFYQQGAEFFPDLFEMHYFKGICYLWLGQLDKAKASLERSLELNPSFFWTYYNLALIYLKAEQPIPALKMLSFAKQIPLEPTEEAIHTVQAFQIIWRYMPDPNYIHSHLLKVRDQIEHAQSEEIQQWRPVFF